MAEPFLAPYRFETGEFVLRVYQPGDGEALRVATVESYEHLRPWMNWATQDQTVEQAEAICRKLAAAYLSGTDYTLGIWQGDDLLGGTGFHMRCGPIEWKCAEVGMWIRDSRAGSGLGTRVLAALLDWGFGEWGWERLIWKCEVQNIASARVAEKNGFTLEATHKSDAVGADGLRRDTHLYVKLRGQDVVQGRR